LRQVDGDWRAKRKTREHTNTRTNTHKHTHKHTQTHTNTRARAHTHTHTRLGRTLGSAGTAKFWAMLSFFFLTSSAVPFCFLMYGFYGLLIGEGWVGGRD